MWTPVVVLVSEIPCWIFTILDYLQMDCLRAYRMSQRSYPTRDQLRTALCSYIQTLGIILTVTASTFGLIVYTSIPSPYDVAEYNMSVTALLAELFVISLANDVLFYFLHRVAHTPRFYSFHKDHHLYRDDSFALVNHVLHPLEILVFMLPPAVAPIVINSHVYVVWIYAILTNLIGTIGHSGYEHQICDLILLNPRDHDMHHRKPYKNFSTGFCYSLVDRLCGTYTR